MEGSGDLLCLSALFGDRDPRPQCPREVLSRGRVFSFPVHWSIVSATGLALRERMDGGRCGRLMVMVLPLWRISQ